MQSVPKIVIFGTDKHAIRYCRLRKVIPKVTLNHGKSVPIVPQPTDPRSMFYADPELTGTRD